MCVYAGTQTTRHVAEASTVVVCASDGDREPTDAGRACRHELGGTWWIYHQYKWRPVTSFGSVIVGIMSAAVSRRIGLHAAEEAVPEGRGGGAADSHNLKRRW
jgi:hypothetical protein